MKMVCPTCGYVYDPENGDPVFGVNPNTPWDCVPETWECPNCMIEKDFFEPKEDRGVYPMMSAM